MNLALASSQPDDTRYDTSEGGMPPDEIDPSSVRPPDENLRTDPDRGVGEMGTEGSDPSWLILPEGDEEPTKSPSPELGPEDQPPPEETDGPSFSSGV